MSKMATSSDGGGTQKRENKKIWKIIAQVNKEAFFGEVETAFLESNCLTKTHSLEAPHSLLEPGVDMAIIYKCFQREKHNCSYQVKVVDWTTGTLFVYDCGLHSHLLPDGSRADCYNKYNALIPILVSDEDAPPLPIRKKLFAPVKSPKKVKTTPSSSGSSSKVQHTPTTKPKGAPKTLPKGIMKMSHSTPPKAQSSLEKWTFVVEFDKEKFQKFYSGLQGNRRHTDRFPNGDVRRVYVECSHRRSGICKQEILVLFPGDRGRPFQEKTQNPDAWRVYQSGSHSEVCQKFWSQRKQDNKELALKRKRRRQTAQLARTETDNGEPPDNSSDDDLASMKKPYRSPPPPVSAKRRSSNLLPLKKSLMKTPVAKKATVGCARKGAGEDEVRQLPPELIAAVVHHLRQLDENGYPVPKIFLSELLRDVAEQLFQTKVRRPTRFDAREIYRIFNFKPETPFKPSDGLMISRCFQKSL